MKTKKEKDPNYVIKLEKAIAKKYGELTIKNPKSFWDDEKEREHLEELKKFYDREYKSIDEKGFLETIEKNNTCPYCDIYSLSVRDDTYMNKYGCCFKCYIQYIEDREGRWLDGWRPKRLTN
tara:strand:+ start:203 stop:568 length:366 start_codon:yes stop_codon:yes gene_type:complete